MDYPNKDRLYKAVDKLPNGLDWQCKEIIQTGDLKNANGATLMESLEVWYQDPMDCIRELLGNPLFAKTLVYAPERVYRNKGGTNCHINEMWTANWNLQVNLSVFFCMKTAILTIITAAGNVYRHHNHSCDTLVRQDRVITVLWRQERMANLPNHQELVQRSPPLTYYAWNCLAWLSSRGEVQLLQQRGTITSTVSSLSSMYADYTQFTH